MKVGPNLEGKFSKRDLEKQVDEGLLEIQEGEKYLNFTNNPDDIPEIIVLDKDQLVINGRSVDVFATIMKNNLPLPTHKLLEKTWEDAENNPDKHPWLDEFSGYPHIHCEFGKIGTMVDYIYEMKKKNLDSEAFWFVPYYSYNWSNFIDISGAHNFPIIEKENILLNGKIKEEE